MSRTKKEQTIKVLKVAPKKEPEVVYLENKLRPLQEAVSIGAPEVGLIEVVNMELGVDLLLNEEGKLIPLEPNRRFNGDILCGVFYVIGHNDEGDFCSLSDTNIRKYTEIFKNPEDIGSDEVEAFMKVFFF